MLLCEIFICCHVTWQSNSGVKEKIKQNNEKKEIKIHKRILFNNIFHCCAYKHNTKRSYYSKLNNFHAELQMKSETYFHFTLFHYLTVICSMCLSICFCFSSPLWLFLLCIAQICCQHYNFINSLLFGTFL